MVGLLAFCALAPSPGDVPISRWGSYGDGFQIDPAVAHVGRPSLRCEAADGKTVRGASETFTLNQAAATPLLVSGWSRAAEVDGSPNGDYSVYIDAIYRDGTPDWGMFTPFATGTHGWQRRQVLISPAKPLRSITVYALFRYHKGTAWFDDFQVRTLGGKDVFDSQLLPPPSAKAGPARLRLNGLGIGFDGQGRLVRTGTGTPGGFSVRDVKAGAKTASLAGQVAAVPGGAELWGRSKPLGLAWRGSFRKQGGGYQVDLDLRDLTGRDRAVTAYLALPVDAVGWRWGRDIRHSEPIRADGEYSGLTNVPVGAAGAMSLYPFACVSNDRRGLVLGTSLDRPSVYRIFYNAPRRQLVLAWDVALTGRSSQKGRSHVRGWIDALGAGEAAWGFRAAVAHLYAHDPEGFRRRAKRNGIWMPFTDPATVRNPQDFGIAFHEGDNSVASDDRLGIASFRYTEPMSNWMPMAPAEPRTYANAVRLLKQNAESSDAGLRDSARATLLSGTADPASHLNVEFRNEPWCDGAVFVLDPNPALPSRPGWPTKATLNYNRALADKEYGQARGGLDGEYLDSLESWSQYLDYSPRDMAAHPWSPTFDSDGRPVLPQWFSTYAFTRNLSEDLHRRKKLLMANTTPVQFSVFAPLLDVMGIETNWLGSDGTWQPIDDETFDYRRTMSGQKPYLLLQNTNFARFTNDDVRRYFQRCAFYAVFPSMFSADAATHPYWEDPKLYDRDRALFKEWIPEISRLSAAGWQPLTFARTNDPKLYVERYGSHLFTVFNDSQQARAGTVAFDLSALGLGKGVTATDRFGRRLTPRIVGGRAIVDCRLAPEECLVLDVR